MIENEVIAAVNYANAIDPRVQSNQPTYELWHKVLAAYRYVEAQAAIQLFYERYADPTQRPVVDPASVRRIITQETTRAVAKHDALDATPRQVTNPMSWRARNPHEWDRLFKQGAADRQADLRHRGLIK